MTEVVTNQNQMIIGCTDALIDCKNELVERRNDYLSAQVQIMELRSQLESRGLKGKESNNTGLTDSLLDVHSMKFPKPRTLVVNDYPDSVQSDPEMLQKLVQDILKPDDDSPLGKYIESSILFLKEQKKKRLEKAETKINRLDNTELSRKLYFTTCTPWYKKKFLDFAFRALVDTGAANSLIHSGIIASLGLKYTPYRCSLTTVNGRDDDSVKGIIHLKFGLVINKGEAILACTNFIVTSRLNGLEAIIGAEFLMDNDIVKSISRDSMTIVTDNGDRAISISAKERVDDKDDLYLTKRDKIIDLTCQGCGNKKGPPPPAEHFLAPVWTNHTYWKTIRPEIEPRNSSIELDDVFRCVPERDLNPVKHCNLTELDPSQADSLIDLPVLAHSFKQTFENETLPPSDEAFGEPAELKFEILDKTISLNDGDYSQCPPEWLGPLKSLLNDFHDRFSKTKLDIEVTDWYEAALDTVPGRKVVQRVRTLPQHKFEFALKAVRQLEAAGIVRESDSPWRSNVVMIPKPTGKNELRATTKADYQTGDQHKAQHYRICLDFRDLNDILIFPQQVAFPTLDRFLHKLRNKVVICMDISSSFYVIPIKEEDRYKTAFWLNDLAFEFNVLVMGVTHAPYHLKKFVNEEVFTQKNYDKYVTKLSKREREILPPSFEDILANYFDDCFVIGDDYEQALAGLKLVLMIARDAKIKFSIEKSSFLTTKVKVWVMSLTPKMSS